MNYDSLAKLGVWAQRLCTFAAFPLALCLFLFNMAGGMMYLTLALVWISYTLYRVIKTVSGLLRDPGGPVDKFTAMLAKWEGDMNGRGMAVTVYALITLVSCAFKLAVPFILLAAAA